MRLKSKYIGSHHSMNRNRFSVLMTVNIP